MRIRQRPSMSRIAVLLAVLVVVTGPVVAGMLEVAELVSHPDQYDKQMVVVVGKVSNVQTAENRQGQTAYGFLLKDSNATVKVVGLGKTDVREGEQVIVEGIFSRLRQAGRAVIYNEIKANLIRHVDRMTPDFVG